jgi:CBS-domain-containing membrane protein
MAKTACAVMTLDSVCLRSLPICGEAVMVGADDSAEDNLVTMRRHQVQRLPVIDGQRMIGIVALADVARVLSDPPVGALVDALSVDR